MRRSNSGGSYGASGPPRWKKSRNSAKASTAELTPKWKDARQPVGRWRAPNKEVPPATPRFGLSEERARGDAACFRNATGVKLKLATNSHQGVSATPARGTSPWAPPCAYGVPFSFHPECKSARLTGKQTGAKRCLALRERVSDEAVLQ
jgi:hypothetical protein